MNIAISRSITSPWSTGSKPPITSSATRNSMGHHDLIMPSYSSPWMKQYLFVWSFCLDAASQTLGPLNLPSSNHILQESTVLAEQTISSSSLVWRPSLGHCRYSSHSILSFEAPFWFPTWIIKMNTLLSITSTVTCFSEWRPRCLSKCEYILPFSVILSYIVVLQSSLRRSPPHHCGTLPPVPPSVFVVLIGVINYLVHFFPVKHSM